MERSLRFLHRLTVLAVLTVALIATGFGHRIPSAGDMALQQYVLSGGSVADLCGDLDGDSLPDHSDCPACHIVATAAPPDARLSLHDADLFVVAKIVAPRESRVFRSVLDPARSLRAPPLA